jgi:hypothetical protein
MQNNRKVARTGVTDGNDTLILGRQPVFARQKPVMACNFAKIPCSQAGDRFAHDCSHHHPVFPNRAFRRATPKRPFLRGFRRYRHRAFCLCGHQRSLEPIFGLRSLHPKIPFLASWISRGKGRSAAWKSGIPGGKNAVSSRGRNYCGFCPSASNGRLHSAGASRSRSNLMPRGRQPSTSALTRSRARNASEIVILT